MSARTEKEGQPNSSSLIEQNGARVLESPREVSGAASVENSRRVADRKEERPVIFTKEVIEEIKEAITTGNFGSTKRSPFSGRKQELIKAIREHEHELFEAMIDVAKGLYVVKMIGTNEVRIYQRAPDREAIMWMLETIHGKVKASVVPKGAKKDEAPKGFQMKIKDEAK
jgi:anti-sigma28 factor (negative regulator of flagellin synthesis)